MDSLDEDYAFQSLEMIVARVELCVLLAGRGIDKRVGHVQPMFETVIGGLQGQRLVYRDNPRLAERGDRFQGSLLSPRPLDLPIDLVKRKIRLECRPSPCP